MKYVWHRGGKFIARARGRERAHVFESLTDLQAIQSSTRNKILQPVVCNAPGTFEAGETRPIVLGRGSSAICCKLGPVVEDYLVQIDGYTLFQQDREVGGGGVALYIRNTLKVKILKKSNTTQTDDCNELQPQPEYLMCSVQQGNSFPVFVAVVCRPPHVGLYTNGLDEHLLSCGEEFSHKVIMGDSNADLIEPNAETRLNFIDKHSLKDVDHGATHHTRMTTTTSDTHIDLIRIDSQDRLLNFNKFPSPYDKNGHDLITVTIKLFVAEPSKASFSYHDYKSIHPEALMADPVECD